MKDTISITSIQRTLSKAPKIDFTIVLIHFSSLKSGQPLYSGQFSWSRCVHYTEVPLYTYPANCTSLHIECYRTLRYHTAYPSYPYVHTIQHTHPTHMYIPYSIPTLPKCTYHTAYPPYPYVHTIQHTHPTQMYIPYSIPTLPICTYHTAYPPTHMYVYTTQDTYPPYYYTVTHIILYIYILYSPSRSK